MIQPQELRLGNILYHKFGKTVDVTVGIIEQFVGNKKFANKVWTPIPLTEEWLVRLGFTCVSRYSFHNYALPNNFIISMWMEDKPTAGFEEKGVCYWGEYFTAIKFVHQLQNLYFALTGEELTLK